MLPSGVVLLQNGAAQLQGGDEAVGPVLPWLNSAFGAGALAVQSAWNFRHKGANDYAKAAGIIGNVTTLTAPLASAEVAGSTEDISVAVKVLLGVVCGLGGAILTVES